MEGEIVPNRRLDQNKCIQNAKMSAKTAYAPHQDHQSFLKAYGHLNDSALTLRQESEGERMKAWARAPVDS